MKSRERSTKSRELGAQSRNNKSIFRDQRLDLTFGWWRELRSEEREREIDRERRECTSEVSVGLGRE